VNVILADTTVWIDHFRTENAEMRKQLEKKNIVIHPYIVAELALGSLRERTRTLAWLDKLPQVPVAQIREVRQMIEMSNLYSRGIGLTDASLIASILIHPPTLLWTLDRRLSTVAGELGIAANLH
jgi:predicted nucleic acid-binding protein